MAARRFGFRPKLREQLHASNAAQRNLLAAMDPADPRYAANKARLDSERAEIKPVRARAAPVQREAPVVAAIAELLAVHPRVLFAVRQNSGMASYEAKSGKYAPVHFYRILTEHYAPSLTITDFWGILRDGRVLAIEAKAPNFREPRTDREFKQAAFLMLVRNVGGVALFATSAEQVAEALA